MESELQWLKCLAVVAEADQLDGEILSKSPDPFEAAYAGGWARNARITKLKALAELQQTQWGGISPRSIEEILELDPEVIRYEVLQEAEDEEDK